MDGNTKVKKICKQVIATVSLSALVFTNSAFGELSFVDSKNAIAKVVEESNFVENMTEEVNVVKPEVVKEKTDFAMEKAIQNVKFKVSAMSSVKTMASSSDLVYGDFTYIVSGNSAIITGYTGSGGSVVIPDSIDGYEVIAIGNEAFKGCSSLTSIKIPNGVTYIGLCVFYGCSSLISIEIPNSVTSIGSEVFYGCSSLTSIEIPNSVKSMSDDMFSGCSSLTSIEIPNSVTSIGSHSFYGCKSLTSIEIPNSVTYIASYTFVDCSSLTSIEIPNSVKSIGSYAFYGCSSLTSIEIPNSITSIGDFMFAECSSLTSIEIPNSVTYIASYTFVDCSSLTSIEIPNSVTCIDSGVFAGCKSLTSIEIPNSVISIETEVFSGCSSLTSIKIPNSVTSIGYYAFDGCSNLTIYGQTNSYAETYAKGEDIPFAPIGLYDEIIFTPTPSPTSSPDGAVSSIFPIEEGATQVTLNNYTVYVTDTSGNPIYNAHVTIGVNTDSTDNKGKVSFTTVNGKEKDGVTTISLSVAHMGYTDYTCSNYAVNENHVCYVTLKTISETVEEETSYNLIKGEYLDSVLYKDALLGNIDLLVKQKTISLSEADSTFDLTVNVLEDKKELVKGYHLYSGSSRVADSENGVFSGLKYSQFTADKKVYVELDIEPGSGDVKRASTSRQAINLSVKSPSENTKTSYGSLELGKTLAFTVAEDVPFIGGKKFDLKKLNLPIDMKFSSDGSFILTINTDEKKIVNKENVFFKDYDTDKIVNKDELDENLYNVFASSVKKSTENLANGKEDEAFKEFDLTFSDDFTFTTRIGGYIAGKLSDSVKKGTGNLYILAKASYKAETTAIIYTVPFTVSMEVGANGKASATLNFDFTDTSKTFGESITGDVLFSFTPYVDVGVGPGSSDLNIKLNGGFSMPINYYMLGEKQGLQSIILQANASVSGKVFCWEKEWEFYNDTYNVYTRAENRNIQSFSIANMVKKALNMEENCTNVYTDVSNLKVQSVSSKSIKDWNSSTNGSEEIELLDEVSNYTDTQTVTAGDTTVMVYRNADIERDSYNADTLYYSVYDEATKEWGMPKQVDNNETADYDFSLYADKENIYLVYQEMASKHSKEDTVQEMAADTRIAYTKFNQTERQFRTTEILTDNTNYVMHPTIVTNENVVTVAWVENTSTDYYALNNTNSIVTKSCINDVWQDAVILAEKESNICELKGCVLNGVTYFAYITDKDNALDTEKDRDVFLVDLEGTIKKLCSDEVMDANLEYVQADSKNALYWYHGDRIVNVTSEQETYNELVEGLQINPNEDFSVIGTAEQQAVLFTKAGENDTTEIYVMYQQKDGSYCEPVQVVENGMYISGYSGTILDGIVILNYRKDNIQKTANSMSISSVLCSQEIDDYSNIECSSISYDYDTLEKGKSLALITDITNAGNHVVSDLQIELVAPSGEIVHSEIKDVTINIGETISKEIEISIPEEIEEGSYTLTLWEDGYTKGTGATENVKFAYAELGVNAEIITLGENTYISATIKNRGDLATKATVSVVNNSDTENTLETIQLEEIKALDSDTALIQITEDMLDEGEIYSDFTVSVIANEEERYQYDNDALVQAESRVKSIQLSKENLELNVGEQETLSVVLEAFGTPKFNYEWNSSNSGVASVDENGVITALAKGEAIITVMTEQGYFVSCKVSVKENKEIVTDSPFTSNTDTTTDIDSTIEHPVETPTDKDMITEHPMETPASTDTVTNKSTVSPEDKRTEFPKVSPTATTVTTEQPKVSPTATTVITEQPKVSQTATTVTTKHPTSLPPTTNSIIGQPKISPIPTKAITENQSISSVSTIKEGTELTIENNVYIVTDMLKKTVSFSGLVNTGEKKVKIPATIIYDGQKYQVTAIEKNALKGNKMITCITIGKNVTILGEKAFYKCKKLTQITIPSKVRKIGKQAFGDCSKLRNITIKTSKLTTENLGNKVFKGIAKKAVIKVPKSKKKAYQKMLKKKEISSKVKVK